MGALWYWLVFAAAAVLFALVPLAHQWEQRQNRRDRETWDRMVRR